LWTSPKDVHQLLEEAPIEQDIKLLFLDIPLVHSFDSESAIQLFDALAEAEDMTIFET
jgi:hypothetical protein